MHVEAKDVHELGAWWKHRAVVPTTIGDEKNFVLFPAELAEYADALAILSVTVEQERVRVREQLAAMKRGTTVLFGELKHPPYTLCDMLKFKVRKGKIELHIVQWAVAVTRRHIDLLKGDSNGLGI